MADELTLEFETEGFRRWTEDLIRGMERRGARRALKAVAFEFLKRVIAKNPVDTGRSRAGWMSYLLANGRQAIAVADPVAIAEGIAASSFQERFSGSEQFIILLNAVEYIVILEFGHSDQAPAGMMRLTFRELQAGETMTKALRDELVREIIATNQKHPAEPVPA
ncbi:MAG: HK97 gp10 family phage protein [Gemmatimonadota bacterium]